MFYYILIFARNICIPSNARALQTLYCTYKMICICTYKSNSDATSRAGYQIKQEFMSILTLKHAFYKVVNKNSCFRLFTQPFTWRINSLHLVYNKAIYLTYSTVNFISVKYTGLVKKWEHFYNDSNFSFQKNQTFRTFIVLEYKNALFGG